MISRMEKEQAQSKRLRKGISWIFRATDEWNGDLKHFYFFSNKEMPSIDVLGPIVMFMIVCQVNGRFVVEGERGRLRGRFTELAEESAQVHRFLCGFGGATISASQDDKATVGCFFFDHVIAA
eukprot:2725957-Pleurochrysis_carterae.AAC.3